jgi:hypothetical protein
MRKVSGALIFVLPLVGAAVGCGSDPSRHRDQAPVSPARPPDPGRVVGRLLDPNTKRPLFRWTVCIDDQRTGTDAQGGFTFTDVAPLYDVGIVDPDGSNVTIYRGLTRRDPLLVGGHAAGGSASNLEPPPVLLSPADGDVLTVATEFVWGGLDFRGVYLLGLAPQVPSPDTPNIDIYTADTTVRWPDLRWLGISFPKQPTSYGCWIGGRGTFAGIDEAAGPRGLAGPVRDSVQVVDSASIRLTILEPALPAEALVALRQASADAQARVAAIGTPEWLQAATPEQLESGPAILHSESAALRAMASSDPNGQVDGVNALGANEVGKLNWRATVVEDAIKAEKACRADKQCMATRAEYKFLSTVIEPLCEALSEVVGEQMAIAHERASAFGVDEAALKRHEDALRKWRQQIPVLQAAYKKAKGHALADWWREPACRRPPL